jgi:hypothetical protein
MTKRVVMLLDHCYADIEADGFQRLRSKIELSWAFYCSTRSWMDVMDTKKTHHERLVWSITVSLGIDVKPQRFVQPHF